MTGSLWPSSSEAMTCVSTATIGWVALRSHHRKCGLIQWMEDIFKALPSRKFLCSRVLKNPLVLCDALCGAVSWYHSPNGTKHWSRIIKLCEQPSPNCFIVSEWDESRRGFFSMSTFCHSPPPSSISASVCIKTSTRGHSDRPCSLRGINSTEVDPDSLHPVSLPPFLSRSHFASLFPPLSITLLMLRWQGSLSFNVYTLKQNIKAQHQFKMSSETVVMTAYRLLSLVCSYMLNCFIFSLICWPVSLQWALIMLLFSKHSWVCLCSSWINKHFVHCRPLCHHRNTTTIWWQVWISCTKR